MIEFFERFYDETPEQKQWRKDDRASGMVGARARSTLRKPTAFSYMFRLVALTGAGAIMLAVFVPPLLRQTSAGVSWFAPALVGLGALIFLVGAVPLARSALDMRRPITATGEVLAVHDRKYSWAQVGGDRQDGTVWLRLIDVKFDHPKMLHARRLALPHQSKIRPELRLPGLNIQAGDAICVTFTPHYGYVLQVERVSHAPGRRRKNT